MALPAGPVLAPGEILLALISGRNGRRMGFPARGDPARLANRTGNRMLAGIIENAQRGLQKLAGIIIDRLVGSFHLEIEALSNPRVVGSTKIDSPAR